MKIKLKKFRKKLNGIKSENIFKAWTLYKNFGNWKFFVWAINLNPGIEVQFINTKLCAEFQYINFNRCIAYSLQFFFFFHFSIKSSDARKRAQNLSSSLYLKLQTFFFLSESTFYDLSFLSNRRYRNTDTQIEKIMNKYFFFHVSYISKYNI